MIVYSRSAKILWSQCSSDLIPSCRAKPCNASEARGDRRSLFRSLPLVLLYTALALRGIYFHIAPLSDIMIRRDFWPLIGNNVEVCAMSCPPLIVALMNIKPAWQVRANFIQHSCVYPSSRCVSVRRLRHRSRSLHVVRDEWETQMRFPRKSSIVPCTQRERTAHGLEPSSPDTLSHECCWDALSFPTSLLLSSHFSLL